MGEVEQYPPVHEEEYELSPEHCAPPFAGEGLLQSLELVEKQSLPHLDDDQEPHCPLFGVGAMQLPS